MKFIKKNLSNIIFAVIILLLLIPQTRMPIQVFVQRLISFSPSTIAEEKREQLHEYNWQLKKLNGEVSNLSKSKNKVVLINLWATWCPPCIAEMPSLQKLYDDYGDKVNFYFISNEKEETIHRFMLKNNYTFPIHQALEAAPKQLSSNTLPTTYILSSSGEIVTDKKGAADWNSSKTREIIDKLLTN